LRSLGFAIAVLGLAFLSCAQNAAFLPPVSLDFFVESPREDPWNAKIKNWQARNQLDQLAIAQRLALLEGAEAALFVASGMGATALAHLAVLRPGDHLITSDWIYGGVHRLFAEATDSAANMGASCATGGATVTVDSVAPEILSIDLLCNAPGNDGAGGLLRLGVSEDEARWAFRNLI